MHKIHYFEGLQAAVDPALIMSVHGYTENRRPSESIRESIITAAQQAQLMIEPRALYQEFAIERICDDTLVLGNSIVLNTGKTINHLWEGSNRLGIALYTIGEKLEERVSALMSMGEQTDALNLDIAGTVALGVIGFQLQYYACEQSGKLGIKTGPWLNPGYLDWPLADQRLIFSMIPASSVGVELNDHFMMIPRKSVTVSTGIGVTDIHDDFKRCQHCGVAKCPYRHLNAGA